MESNHPPGCKAWVGGEQGEVELEVLKTNLQRLEATTIVVVGIGLVYYAVKRSLTLQEIVTEPKVLHYQVDASSDSLRFLVVGDTGSNDNHQLMVAKAMEER